MALFAGPLLFLAGCASMMTSLKDVSRDPRVQHHIGREFTLKADVYLCTYTFTPAEYPLVEVPMVVGIHGLSNPVLPSPVSAKNIGFTDGKVRIVSILAKGTSFRFEQIMHYSAPSAEYFYIILNTSDIRNPKAEFCVPAIGGISAASDRAFGMKPWFFDYFAQEMTGKK
jgi:hypothetical protein